MIAPVLCTKCFAIGIRSPQHLQVSSIGVELLSRYSFVLVGIASSPFLGAILCIALIAVLCTLDSECGQPPFGC